MNAYEATFGEMIVFEDILGRQGDSTNTYIEAVSGISLISEGKSGIDKKIINLLGITGIVTVRAVEKVPSLSIDVRTKETRTHDTPKDGRVLEVWVTDDPEPIMNRSSLYRRMF